MSQPAPSTPRRGRTCLLVGCLGALALVVIPVAVLWALVAVANSRPPEPRHEVHRHQLPAGPGTIELAVRMADLEVVAAPSGSPLRLEADWDGRSFDLDEALRPGAGSWTYRLHLHGGRLALFRHHAALPNRLRLAIPSDRPVSLTGKVALGESLLALGGLTLDRLDLALGAGEHRVTFGEPTKQPLSLLRLDASMGELTLLDAGNASPRRLDIHQGMGDLMVDLSGGWRNDADVELRLGMGDTRVLLPRSEEAVAVIERARVGLGQRQVAGSRADAGPPGLPRVRLRASGGFGELTIQ